jgi:hypothetical protein
MSQDEFRASKEVVTHLSQETPEKGKDAAVDSNAITPIPPTDLELNTKQIREESQTNHNIKPGRDPIGDLLSATVNIAFTVIGTIFVIVTLLFAGVANDQSMVANQIALLSLCAGNLVR